MNFIRNHKTTFFLAAFGTILVMFLVHERESNNKTTNDISKIFETKKRLNQINSSIALNQSKPVPPKRISKTGEIENPYLGQETKLRLLEISQQFSEDIKFPTNSKPILNEMALQKYIPNKSVASVIATNLKDEHSPRLWLKPAKYQYFSGEPIIANAGIQGTEDTISINISGRIIVDGKSIEAVDGIALEQDPTQFQLAFKALNDVLTSSDIRVVARFSVSNKEYEVGAPIKYVSPIANIEHIGVSQVHGAYLHIPVYIHTSTPGFHQVSANLYNANNGQALIHLSEQKNLLVENDFIELKAHIGSLQASGHQGPYKLKNISLVRMPSKPNYTTEYGMVLETSVSVDGFPFEEYEHTPYYDPNANLRKEFLKRL